MNKIALFVFACLLSLNLNALTVQNTAGSLTAALADAGAELSTLTDLTVTGSLNARDFKNMRDLMPLLSTLDLRNTTIEAYTGTAGTYNAVSQTYPANTIPKYAFYSSATMTGKTSLTSVKLPEGVTTVAEYAFNKCTSIVNMQLPTTLVTVENFAFSSCSALQTINFPNTLRSIGNSSFRSCYTLNNITLPEGLLTLSSSAFRSDTSLTEITIPATLTSIGSSVFYYCLNLKRVVYKAIDCISSASFSPTEVVFYNCPKLTSFEIGTGVVSLPASLFMTCSGLTSINLPNSLTSMGNFVFIECRNLKSIVLPSGLKALPRQTFTMCTGLTSVELPANLASIDVSAFESCTSLSKIDLPKSVSAIENNAFYNCTSLNTINCYAETPADLTSKTNVFLGVNKLLCTLHVPAGSKTSYQAAAQWSDFYNIVEDLPTATSSLITYKPEWWTERQVLQVRNAKNGSLLTVFDGTGTLVYRAVLENGQATVKLSKPGLYLARLDKTAFKVHL